MDIKLYNTLTREKEDFKPIEDGKVKIYSCGPTVYAYPHIGNYRSYLFMDSLRRVLKYNGYELLHAMNITDVGHLVSDADEGEDKMMKAARIEKKDPYEIAEFYMNIFLDGLEKLNISKPEIICRATEHIKIMENYVKKIIENGYAYETDKTIYFDTSKLDKYGILSKIKIDEQKAGARVEFDKQKKNNVDFAIWIKADENHIMKWDSFWGKCYPGWHLECSAMSQHYLGDVFDIHTGGVDHIPIHHENEIAQSKGATGKIPAHYWMHCEFLQINGGKMSKSLGNLYTLDDLAQKGYEPLVLKMFNYGSHYRTQINFTWEALNSAKIALKRLKEGYANHLVGKENIDRTVIDEFEERFHKEINDDLNLTNAMSIVWEVIRYPKKSKDFADLLRKFDEVLALDIDKPMKQMEVIPEEVKKLVADRTKARAEKKWNLSDEIRNEIIKLGYNVKDTKDGMVVEKI